MKYRHEYKHVITYIDYLTVRQRLLMLCQRDKYTREAGHYLVRSLYFDNANNKALFEKIDGVNDREKYRIRYYNGDLSFIRLERKSKHNGLCYKQSSRITADQVKNLLKYNWHFLQEVKDPLFSILYFNIITLGLRPKTIIDYQREAYIYPVGNIRITFDSNIRTGGSSLDFLDPFSPTVSTGPNFIMEVKYDEYFPSILSDAIQTGGRSAAAFSKYAVGRIFG